LLTFFTVTPGSEIVSVLSVAATCIKWFISVSSVSFSFLPSFLPPRPLYPRERAPGTHSIGWVGPRAVLDEVVK